MLSFKPTFSLSSFTFIKRLFSSSLSAIRVVSSAYLRLLIFLPEIHEYMCTRESKRTRPTHDPTNAPTLWTRPLRDPREAGLGYLESAPHRSVRAATPPPTPSDPPPRRRKAGFRSPASPRRRTARPAPPFRRGEAQRQSRARAAPETRKAPFRGLQRSAQSGESVPSTRGPTLASRTPYGARTTWRRRESRPRPCP